MEGRQRANDVPARALSLEPVLPKKGTAEIADGNQRMKREASAGLSGALLDDNSHGAP